MIGTIKAAVFLRGINMGDSATEKFIPKLVDLIMDGRFPVADIV